VTAVGSLGTATRVNLAAMDSSLATARILRFLEEEPVVWLSTVRPDGSPHLVPTWFWWDGEALLVFSKPSARKVRNLRANPSVMLALGDAEDDFDVGLIEGRAELLDRPAAKVLPVAHVAKYADRLATLGLTDAEYAATYSQVIRIAPNDFLGWHGRSTPRSARLAGAPAASIAEPRRDGDDADTGEPLAVGRWAIPAPRVVRPERLRPSVLGGVGVPLGRALRGLTDGFGQPRGLPISL
jgi:PPOX class probable F420-dependent enzyme